MSTLLNVSVWVVFEYFSKILLHFLFISKSLCEWEKSIQIAKVYTPKILKLC